MIRSVVVHARYINVTEQIVECMADDTGSMFRTMNLVMTQRNDIQEDAVT